MKIAFFVEGYTELQLIKRLAIYYYGLDDLSYTLFKLKGGNKIPVSIRLIENYQAKSGNPKNTINVYNCGGFTSLRSMIVHQRNSLHNNQFDKIIGIRDVHPDDRSQIPKLKMLLPCRIPQKPIHINFILCVMETEAWFIADENHYLKISPTLTKSFIKSKTGIDIDNLDFESIETPADKLNEIYNHAGELYEKTDVSLQRTIDALDLYNFIIDLPEKIPSLKEFITEFE